MRHARKQSFSFGLSQKNLMGASESCSRPRGDDASQSFSNPAPKFKGPLRRIQAPVPLLNSKMWEWNRVYYAAAGQTAWMKKKDGSQVRFAAFGGAYARPLRARCQVPSAACNNALLAKSYAAVVMVRLFVRSPCNVWDEGARIGDSGRLLCVVSVGASAILAEALQEFCSECRAAAPADSRSSKALIFELGAASHCRAVCGRAIGGH